MTLIDSAPRDTTTGRDADVTAGALVWSPVCLLADLETGWAEAALVGDHQVALVSFGHGELYAVSHIDPHTGAPVMARGIVGSRHVEDAGHRPTIASPLLKQVYDLGTGSCFSDPALTLTTYRSRVVDGVVEVGVPR